jgi:hypothetical protein
MLYLSFKTIINGLHKDCEVPRIAHQHLHKPLDGFSSLIPIFDLNSPIDIYPSSDRSILAHMNELRRNYVDQFEMFNTIHTLDFQKVEDVYLNYPFSMKSRGSKLYTTKEILEELLD